MGLGTATILSGLLTARKGCARIRPFNLSEQRMECSAISVS